VTRATPPVPILGDVELTSFARAERAETTFRFLTRHNEPQTREIAVVLGSVTRRYEVSVRRASR